MAQSNEKAKSSAVIDENLKRVYDEMLDEKVPDRFIDLLAQLKAQDKPDSSEAGQ